MKEASQGDWRQLRVKPLNSTKIKHDAAKTRRDRGGRRAGPEAGKHAVRAAQRTAWAEPPSAPCDCGASARVGVGVGVGVGAVRASAHTPQKQTATLTLQVRKQCLNVEHHKAATRAVIQRRAERPQVYCRGEKALTRGGAGGDCRFLISHLDPLYSLTLMHAQF